MGTPIHQAAIFADHATDASWRAVAEAAAGELAAVRVRLAAIESLLGLPTPPAVPERCHGPSGLAERDNPCSPRLSRREAEVLGQLAAGRSNRDIARALCLSPRTVQRHVANAYLKIGAHNKADATAFALRHHLT